MNRHGRGQEREGGSAGLQQETSPGSGSNFYIVPLGLVHLFRRAACANNLQRERMDGTILASVFPYIPTTCRCLWAPKMSLEWVSVELHPFRALHTISIRHLSAAEIKWEIIF